MRALLLTIAPPLAIAGTLIYLASYEHGWPLGRPEDHTLQRGVVFGVLVAVLVWLLVAAATTPLLALAARKRVVGALAPGACRSRRLAVAGHLPGAAGRSVRERRLRAGGRCAPVRRVAASWSGTGRVGPCGAVGLGEVGIRPDGGRGVPAPGRRQQVHRGVRPGGTSRRCTVVRSRGGVGARSDPSGRWGTPRWDLPDVRSGALLRGTCPPGARVARRR